MNNHGASPQLRTALERLVVHDHLCLIYETRAEQFAAIVPFVRIGLERGEQCFYIADDNTAQTVLEALQGGGIDTGEALRSGQLTIFSKRDTYLKQGTFDPDWMIGFLAESTRGAKAAGFAALRVMGEMTWQLGGDPGAERLIEYEAELNRFLPAHDALAICQYNRARFSPEIILDVIRTHPLVIAGGVVCRNFYYVPPGEFLKPEQSRLEVNRLLANIREREEADEALRESEERYRRLVELLPDGVVVHSEGRIVFANPASSRIIGAASTAEMTGKPVIEFVHPDYRALALKRIQQSFSDGAPVPIAEEKFVRLDGTPIDVEVSATPFSYADKPAMLTVFNDITERKQAEQALIDSELKYRALVDAAHDVIFRIDKETCLSSVNPAFEALTHWPPAEWIGQTFASLVHPDDVPRAFEAFGRVLAGESVPAFESRIRTQTGTYLEFEITGASLWEHGAVVGTIGVARDITARKRAEQALAASETELRALFASMRDVVLVIDREGIYRKIGPTNPAVWYIPPQELLGKRLHDIFPAEQAEDFSGVVQQVLDTKQNARIEYELIVGDQSAWFESSISPMNADSTLWVARDITVRKHAQAQISEQLAELRRWHDATLGRETRILALKREVNELLGQAGRPPRYLSVET